MRMWKDDAQGSIVWPVLAMAFACALLLVLPGAIVTTKYVNDLLIFLDGAYRVTLGYVPNRDFHTALGPLAFYIPAAGAWVSGSFGTAMAWGMAGMLALIGPIAAHVLSSRMRPVLALPFAAFLILILAVPMNVGEAITDLSFAMFYNRIGWVALGLLLAMQLSPSLVRRRQTLLDTASAATLVLLLLYLKASYGVVALAFLGLMLLDRDGRGWALRALGIVLVAGLLVEAVWRSTAAHVADLVLASQVSGSVRDLPTLVDFLLRNLADYVLFTFVAGLALWRTRRLHDVFFYGLCAGAGLLLIAQNFQGWGVLTLHAGAAVAAERLARSVRPEDLTRPFAIPAAAPLFLIGLLLPTIVHCTAALTLHTALSTARAGESFGLPNLEQARLARVWRHDDHAGNARYVATLREGVSVLQELDPPAGRVFVLDFVSPFSVAMGLQPPRGDTAWLHWGRTLNEHHFIPPETVLRDVAVVMEPKHAIEGITSDNLRVIFGEYLEANYTLVRDTPEWRVYARNDSAARTSQAVVP